MSLTLIATPDPDDRPADRSDDVELLDLGRDVDHLADAFDRLHTQASGVAVTLQGLAGQLPATSSTGVWPRSTSTFRHHGA